MDAEELRDLDERNIAEARATEGPEAITNMLRRESDALEHLWSTVGPGTRTDSELFSLDRAYTVGRLTACLDLCK